MPTAIYLQNPTVANARWNSDCLRLEKFPQKSAPYGRFEDLTLGLALVFDKLIEKTKTTWVIYCM